MSVRIAHVYPIRPMPRRMGFFDYAVPDALAAVKRGDLVEIPLRNERVPGLVASSTLDAAESKGLKELAAISVPSYLTDAEVSWYEAVAEDLVQSVPSILDAGLPLPPKRGERAAGPGAPLPLTLPKDEAPAIRALAEALRNTGGAFVALPDLRRTAAAVAASLDADPSSKAVLLVPNVRDAQVTHARLSRFSPSLLTGEETNNMRYRAWQSFRNGPSRLLVGTRVAALLPPPSGTLMWVARAGHDNHKNADQNPRVDARVLARISAERLGCRLVMSGPAPRTDDVHGGRAFSAPVPSPETVLADMGQERKQGAHPLIGARLLSELETCLENGRTAILAYNRTGTSRAVRCRGCGHSFPCSTCKSVRSVGETTLRCRACKTEEPFPVSCPVCMGYAIDRTGHGADAIAAALAPLFPGERVTTLEKYSTTPSGPESPPSKGGETRSSPLGGEAKEGSRIIITTSHYTENIFDPFVSSPIGLVAVLDADMPLRQPDAQSHERAVQEAAEWRGVARAHGARFLLQSDAPETFRAAFEDPWADAEEDLRQRAAYGQPPAVRAVRVACRQKPPAAARAAAQKIVLAAKETVAGAEAEASPTSLPGEFAVTLRISHERWPALRSFLATLDDAHIIDTSPIFW